MNIITHNPFRVLGMFANDPVKVQKANVARIRAFNKVGKECKFESDFSDVFGPVDRSDQSIDQAVSLLSTDSNREFYSCIWINRTKQLDLEAKAAVDIIHSGIDENNKASIVNVIVGAIFADNLELASEYILRLFECDDAPSELTKERLLIELENSSKDDNILPPFTWWTHLRDICFHGDIHNESLSFISSVYNKESLLSLRLITKNDLLNNNETSKGFVPISILHNLAKPIIEVIKETSDVKTRQPNAEAQIALSEYAKKLLDACKKYYYNNRFWEAKPVEKLLDLLREVYKLSYSSKIKEECTSFGKKIKNDLQYLAPAQVSVSSSCIRKEIESFCSKPNETRWSLLLIQNCVNYLIDIKESLGVDSVYYKHISTQIADNAIYASKSEIEHILKETDNNIDLAIANLTKVLSLASQLRENISVLDLEDDFRNNKLYLFSELLNNCAHRYLISLEKPLPTISIDNHDSIYGACNDYESLVEFTLNYPQSHHYKEAIKRIWKIEDDDFNQARSINTAKSFLAYKEKYPSSHNDRLVLDALNSLLLSRNSIGTVSEYQTLLNLWPNHPQKSVIIGRIDLASFKLCNNTDDFNKYLSDFPNGLYRNEALKKIQEEKYNAEREIFNRCKSVAEYNRFILQYPSSKLCSIALNKIEDYFYSHALQSGEFNSYLKRFPQGRYVKSIKQLQEDNYFSSCKSKEDFKKYLQLYPNGIHVKKANAFLTKKRNRSIINALFILVVLFVLGFSIFGGIFTGSEKSKNTVYVSNKVESINHNDKYEIEKDVAKPNNNEKYINNSLETGAKPYTYYFGNAQTGQNYISFKTSGKNDYIAIVKRHISNKYVNHIYIRGGESARLYVPDGNFDVYFYSGKGWDPNLSVGQFTGGFVKGGNMQKDGPVLLESAYLEYTLYPVTNGNLTLKNESIDNVFN